MGQTAEQFLKELCKQPPEPKKCACGKPMGIVSSERPLIDGKQVCEDCTANAAGDVTLGHPGRHGPGVAAHLDKDDDGRDEGSWMPALGGPIHGHKVHI
jgi:hypothetical protein